MNIAAMNIAILIHSGILNPLQHLKRKWVENRPSSTRATTLTRCDKSHIAAKFVAPRALVTGSARQSVGRGMPLRVVRVVEAGQTRASVGRMVISGRMADVCAELDRLADREAALST